MLPACSNVTPVRQRRRKSLSRRIVQGVREAEPTIRQRGYVYQKGRKKSDPWSPKELAYGRYRVDIPGQQQQKEVRAALGYCRDRIDALLSLQRIMGQAGAQKIVDASKIAHLRSEGHSWREITEETGISKGTAQRTVSNLPKNI
jgi:uncharacterized protein YerC